jgi:hypothetical protein
MSYSNPQMSSNPPARTGLSIQVSNFIYLLIPYDFTIGVKAIDGLEDVTNSSTQ